MKKYVFVSIIVLLLLVIVFFGLFIVENMKIKEDYVKIYNSCAQNIEKNYNESLINEAEIFKFDECTAKGGCYWPCGGCNGPKNSLNLGEFAEELLGKNSGCPAVCVPMCLLPPK